MWLSALVEVATAGPPEVIDSVQWYEDLARSRPELLAEPRHGIDDAGYAALVIRPAWRDEIRTTKATYASIVAREYIDVDRKADAVWAERLRQGQRVSTAHGRVRAGPYPLDAYASYTVGEGPARDGEGWSYKVFFEVGDFQRTLTPDRYLAFVDALDAAGFHGDSKIDLRPGVTRFRYNDVIVHAPSIADARCAEAVGTAVFGGTILHVARGVDPPAARGDRPLDWHHALMAGLFDRLPQGFRDFVQYVGPDATAGCR